MILTNNFKVLSDSLKHYNISCPARYLKNNLKVQNKMDEES